MKQRKKYLLPKHVTSAVLLLFGSYLILMVLGFMLKREQTFALGELNYGIYAIVASVVGIAMIIFHFGYFISLQVLLAANVNADREKKLLAAGIAIALACGTIMALALWLLAPYLSLFYDTDLTELIRSISPIVICLPLGQLLYAYGTGTGALKVNMASNIIPKAIFLLWLILWLSNALDANVNDILHINYFSSFIAFSGLLIWLRPDFSQLARHIGIIRAKTRSFGRKYYSGSLVNQTTYRLDEVCLGYFIDPIAVGIYTLASMVCAPMFMMSQSLSTTMFKRYGDAQKIPRAVFIMNSAWLLISFLGLWFLGPFVVSWIFPAAFSEVTSYLVPIGLVLLVHGSTTPFSFLAAKSKGKEIRNIAWAEAVVNIAGNLMLIPIYGIMGAVIASFLAKTVHLSMLIWYYRRYQADLNLR